MHHLDNVMQFRDGSAILHPISCFTLVGNCVSGFDNFVVVVDSFVIVETNGCC